MKKIFLLFLIYFVFINNAYGQEIKEINECVSDV